MRMHEGAPTHREMHRPKEIPSLLYKYVSAERALGCLPEVGDGTLRTTQPAALNDPFECAIRNIFVSDQSAETDLAAVLSTIHEQSPVTEQDVVVAKERHGSQYIRELMAKQLSYRFGVISLSTKPLSMLLWAYYTTDGSGFVIGYRSDKLNELGEEGNLRPVRYISELPLSTGHKIWLDKENIRILLSTKSADWEHEHEWRLIIEMNKTIGTGKLDAHDHPVNLLRVPNEAVAKVLYTERTPKSAVEEIANRLKSPINRYGVRRPTKLIMSDSTYGYEIAR